MFKRPDPFKYVKENDPAGLREAIKGKKLFKRITLPWTKINPNAKGKNGPILHRVIVEKWFAVAEDLVKAGADLRARDKKEMLPVHLAIQHLPEFAEKYLMEGLETPYDVFLAAALSIQRSNRKIFNKLYPLLKKEHLEMQTKANKNTLLHLAANEGKKAFFDHVISLYYDYRPELKVNAAGKTPAHIAAAHGTFHMFKAIVSLYQESLLIRDSKGRYPLHLSMHDKRKINLIKESLSQEEFLKQMSQKDNYGNVPLHYLARSGSLTEAQKQEILHELNGLVDPSLWQVKNHEGETPTDYLPIDLRRAYALMDITKELEQLWAANS